MPFPGASTTVVFPLFYSGLSRRLEDERVTRETLDTLPERIRALPVGLEKLALRTGGIDFVRRSDETPEQVTLNLELTDSNIDRVESMSCDEIVAGLESRTRAAYAVIPSRAELCERYGDSSNARIYMFLSDVERKWLDLYLAKNPAVFEGTLTHLKPGT